MSCANCDECAVCARDNLENETLVEQLLLERDEARRLAENWRDRAMSYRPNDPLEYPLLSWEEGEMNLVDEIQKKCVAIDELLQDVWSYVLRAEKERDEARAAFDSAMEYADSAAIDLVTGDNGEVVECGMRYHKPRPVAPREGEK